MPCIHRCAKSCDGQYRACTRTVGHDGSCTSVGIPSFAEVTQTVSALWTRFLEASA